MSAVEQPTVPEEAIAAAARGLGNCEPIAGGWGCYCQPTADDDSWIRLPGTWNEHIAAVALAAAVPVLLEELAQRIEEKAQSGVGLGAMTLAADLVRGFAAEVTQ